MDIVEGGIYRTRSGSLIGPVAWDDDVKVWRSDKTFERNTGDYWHENGSRYAHVDDGMDFVERVDDKPANRFYGEQRMEIKPGDYGRVSLHGYRDDKARVEVPYFLTSEELREAANFFNQLAEYMESED